MYLVHVHFSCMFIMWSSSKIKFGSLAQIFQRPFSELHSVTSLNSSLNTGFESQV